MPAKRRVLASTMSWKLSQRGRVVVADRQTNVVEVVVLTVLETLAPGSSEWQLSAVELSEARGRPWPIPAGGLTLIGMPARRS